ncbi:MAG: uridine kinase [Bacteroidia bacterium]|nr:uridine kinase [Bacteroidia bacterium]
MQVQKPYLVGITGGSAMGKTHFLNSLKQLFSTDELCVISQDNYYKLAFEHQLDPEGNINFDLPECIDLKAFAEDLEKLHNNETIHRNEYLFQHENQVGPLLTFKPAPIIVCEGLFIFYSEEIRKQFDLKIFIQADESIALNRRLKRDSAERNIPIDYIHYQWNNHVMPAYQKFLLPFMPQADIIVNNNDHFDNSLNVIDDHFRTIIGKK